MKMELAKVHSGLISIIVPVYNSELYIAQCMDSIVRQSYNNIEIIVVNDGSTDNSLNILKKFASLDSRIHIISKENSGLSSARNTGISYAKGEFIMFVDSDDWIDYKTCEKAISIINNDNADVVLWSYVREYPNTSRGMQYFGTSKLRWSNGRQKDLWRRMVGPIDEELRVPNLLDSMITAWGKLYRRNALNGVYFVDTNIIGTEDALFNIQVFSKIESATYIPDLFSHYRKDDLFSLSHSYKKEKVDQWKEMYKRIYNILKENSVSNQYYNALNNRICLGLIGLGLNLVEDTNMNFVLKTKELNNILIKSYYRKSLKKLRLSYFSFPWKFFFFFAKMRCPFLLICMLYFMNKVRRL